MRNLFYLILVTSILSCNKSNLDEIPRVPEITFNKRECKEVLNQISTNQTFACTYEIYVDDDRELSEFKVELYWNDTLRSTTFFDGAYEDVKTGKHLLSFYRGNGNYELIATATDKDGNIVTKSKSFQL